MSDPRTDAAISAFGALAKAKLNNLAAKGEPEDQLRAPLEQLFADLAAALGNLDGLALVGETSVASLKARPDYAVTLASTLVGHIELKAPGKGADPRRFKDKHDKAQWDKLKALPNLLYTDGNEFTLWRNGDPVGDPVKLQGDIASAGDLLAAPASFLALVRTFLGWAPIPPNNPLQLAEISARLCKLLRDEVAEQLAQRNPSFTDLANDWRQLLFPDASDKEFADGYAQAVTFGLLMARVRKIKLADGLGNVSKELGRAHSLIGAALLPQARPREARDGGPPPALRAGSSPARGVAGGVHDRALERAARLGAAGGARARAGVLVGADLRGAALGGGGAARRGGVGEARREQTGGRGGGGRGDRADEALALTQAQSMVRGACEGCSAPAEHGSRRLRAVVRRRRAWFAALASGGMQVRSMVRGACRRWYAHAEHGSRRLRAVVCRDEGSGSTFRLTRRNPCGIPDA